MPDLGRGSDRRHARRLPRPCRTRRHHGRHGRRARGRDRQRRAAHHRTDRRLHRAAAGLHAGRAGRRVGDDRARHQGAPHRGGGAGARPHLAANGCVVSAQNGLNELAIAEVVGAGADGRGLRELRRRLPRARRDPLRRSRGGGARRNRRRAHRAGERDSRCVGRLRRTGDRHHEHLGLSVGEGSLRRDALRHCPDQRRRSPMHSPVRNTVHSTSPLRARSWRWRRPVV